MESSNKRYVFTLGALSLAYVVLGLILIIDPVALKPIFCYVLGILAAAVGLIRIIWHFVKRESIAESRSDIPIGVVMLAAGVYIVARIDEVWSVLPVVLGLAILFDSMLKIQHAFELKKLHFGSWAIFILLGLVTAALGVLLLLGVLPADMQFIFFGIALMADGAINIAVLMLLMAKWRAAAKAQAAQPPAVVD